MNKKWTIILRTQGKNNELELKNALNSLLAQSYKNISILLTIHTNNKKDINGTIEFLKPFQEMIEIRPLVITQNQGNRSFPLNLALKKLNSEYVSFLDYDDIYYPQMGSLLISLLEQDAKNFALGRSIKVIQEKVTDNWGNTYLYTREKSYFDKREFNVISFLMDNYIPFNTFVLRTDFIKNTSFDENLDYLEDWDFLRKLVLKKDFSIIQTNTPVSEYRVRNDNSDTYNNSNYEGWVKSRLITDKNIEKEELKVSIKELLKFRQEYNEKLDSLNFQIQKLEINPAYKVWKSVRDNKYVFRSIVQLIRYFRNIKEG